MAVATKSKDDVLTYFIGNALVEIYAKPGIIYFRDASSTGKTYLCSLLKEYNKYDTSVNGYNYEDYVQGEQLPSNCSVLMLDDYELYSTDSDIIKQLDGMSKYSIIFIAASDHVITSLKGISGSVRMYEQNHIIVRGY